MKIDVIEKTIWKYRVDGSGCAGCARAHPIFVSSLSKDKTLARKIWLHVLMGTPNVWWSPLPLKCVLEKKILLSISIKEKRSEPNSSKKHHQMTLGMI